MLEFIFIMAVHNVVVCQKYCQGHIIHYIYIVHIHPVLYSTHTFSILRGILVFFTFSLTPLDLQTNSDLILAPKIQVVSDRKFPNLEGQLRNYLCLQGQIRNSLFLEILQILGCFCFLGTGQLRRRQFRPSPAAGTFRLPPRCCIFSLLQAHTLHSNFLS